MKKIIAGIIAVTAVLCTFAGCGKQGMENQTSDSSSETTTIHETTEAETIEPLTEMAGYSSYEELVKDFVEAYAANDRKKTLYMQYPDDCEDIIRVKMNGEEDLDTGLADDWTEDEAISDMQYALYENYIEDEKVTFNGIVSAEPLMASEVYAIERNRDIIAGLKRYIRKKGGPDNIDRYELTEVESDIISEDISERCEIEEGYFVTFELKDENTGEVSQGVMCVFRIKGESWKVNVLDASGNVIRGRSDFADSVASRVNWAANDTLIEIDEKQLYAATHAEPATHAEAAYIAGSDDSLSFNAPESFDAAFFRERAGSYMSDISEFNWFVVVYKGAAVYCAVENKDGAGYTGVYPPNKVFNGINEKGHVDYSEKTEQKTLKELYDICAEDIGK
ncbi:hypothetical protein [Ruminococcus flavefaciens]|uniref:hypothetical protein n=1 Tax=Ruminococcus flavefaciens TaxID=1265 RepID=UPI0013DCF2B9|nr:hypothetical protein [Ruminococcus flavefaciens]